MWKKSIPVHTTKECRISTVSSKFQIPKSPRMSYWYQNVLHFGKAQQLIHGTYFFRTISEAPLLYIRKLPSGILMTVLIDFLTELKV